MNPIQRVERALRLNEPLDWRILNQELLMPPLRDEVYAWLERHGIPILRHGFARAEELERQRNQPLFKCLRCMDKGLVSHEKMIGGKHVGDVAWFCSCAEGVNREVGYWLDTVYPANAKGRRRKSETGQAALDAYERSISPEKGKLMQEAVSTRYWTEKSKPEEPPGPGAKR